MASEEINRKTRIELKKLAGVENFNATQINEVLQKSSQWISNFYNEASGDKKVKGEFAVEGFSYGGEFDLSTAQDILDGVAPPTGKVPFLFLSDLVNFVEQIRTSLNSKNILLSSTQRAELDKLDSTFKLVGVQPTNNKITVEDLQRIEYIDYSRRIVERIRLIYLVLQPSIEQKKEEQKKEEKEEEKASTSDSFKSRSSVGGVSTQSEDDNSGSGENEENRDDSKKEEPFPDKQPIKISELDPEAKLYIQSLSIITINQALSKYFNAASLEKLGLPPGTSITFDQLPYNTRKELMDRSFLQVEGLLLSGEFSLESLIKEQSQRIIFSNQAALNLLMDVHGLKLLNEAVREIATDRNKTEKVLKDNSKKKLDEKDLGQKSKNTGKNVTDTKFALEILETSAGYPDFAKTIESELNIIGTESRLEDVFSEKIRSIIGQKDSTKIQLIVGNVKPIIEVFIQQGLPPEYLIPNPENFDYNRFVNIFGNSIEREDFNNHKEELANLIIFYWKRKRAIWAREIRSEFNQEKYTPEEAAKLYAKIKDDPKKMAEFRNLGRFNFEYGGTQIAEQLSGKTENKIDDAHLQQFEEQQKKLIEQFLKEQIAKLNQTEQQKTLQVYFEFYMPGTEFTEYSVDIFQTQIAPQINPMDFYMLQAAEQFGPGAFDVNGNGYVQQAFGQGGDLEGTGLMDSALAQQGKKLAAKALSEGLYYALDAAGGFGEALRVAEAAAPIIKKIKERLIELGLEKIIEFVKKNWPWIVALMILGALSSLLPWLLLLAPAGFALYRGIDGLKNLLNGAGNVLGKIGEGLGGGTKQIGAQLGPAQQVGSTQYPQGAQTLLNQFSSSAMATAGQAVIATVGSTIFIIFVYQTSLNSAFLTDFPFNDPNAAGINSVEKTSKYAEISKTATITKGCVSPENNGTKCENPTFPLSIKYTITIKPKEDFSLQITNISDTVKFKQSKQGWEDAGQTMPNIETQKEFDFDYFKNIIEKQGDLSSTPLSATPVPTIDSGNSPALISVPPTSETGVVVIPAGSSLTFSYTLDDLNESYNHAAVLNIIKANFYYQNSYISGNDNVMTAARVCLGDCSAGVGCWPTTGGLTQLPFGIGTSDLDASHRPPISGGYADAYDIAKRGAQLVYTPFPGNLCFIKCSDSGYGCYYILNIDDGGNSRKLLFAHFESANPQLNQPNSCMNVDEGFAIGLMGNRGASSGQHLHYEVDFNGVFYSSTSRSFSILETLVPETDQGNYPPVLGNRVTTCYE